MNEHDDKALDDYLAGDSALSASYREAGDEGPPAALDAAILGQARRAIGRDAPAARPARSRSWFVPLSTAAVVVLAAALVFEITMPGMNEPVPERKAATETAPPQAPATPGAGGEAEALDRYLTELAPLAARARQIPARETGAPTSEQALARLKREMETLRTNDTVLSRTDDGSRQPEKRSFGLVDDGASQDAEQAGRAESDADTLFAVRPPAAARNEVVASRPSDDSEAAASGVPALRADEPPAEAMADALMADAAPEIERPPASYRRVAPGVIEVPEEQAPTDPAGAAAESREAPPIAALPRASNLNGLAADRPAKELLSDAQLQTLTLITITRLAREGDDEEAARLLDEALERWPDMTLPEDFPVPDPREAP